MSVKFSGSLGSSGGIAAAIGKEIRKLNLKAINKITFSFDPFYKNVAPTREFLFILSTPKIRDTNQNCLLRTNIVQEPPSIEFSLSPAVQAQAKYKNLKINPENLSVLELLQQFNKHLTVLAPKEEIVNLIKTKSEKKGVKATKRR